MYCTTSIEVQDSSAVGAARRAAAAMARQAELNETDSEKIAIVVTELGRNLHRYARQGKILLQLISGDNGNGVEVIALDSGPGIPDTSQAQQDGFSTGGTPGCGLGAVKRLSTEFDIFSSQPQGTAVLSRIYSRAGERMENKISWGSVSFPAPGEESCGDAWWLTRREGEVAVMVADGLGHGILAKEAASAAVDAFKVSPFQGPGLFLEAAHRRLCGTRGAALAAAQIAIKDGVVRYSGIGNISGSILDVDLRRGLVSHNGIVGVQFKKSKELDYPLPVNGLLIMHSDGLQTRWTLESYAGLAMRHPAIIAAILARDFIRGRDDATILVLRFEGALQ